MAGLCVTFCALMSALAVPLLLFFGYLLSNSSPMIEIPEPLKPDAGKGCYMAAGLYAVTLCFAYRKMQEEPESAREVKFNQE
mmetsp:Transcript_20654/g.71455  ORF Transcript_20654/g.71455 Transcript_20654/m.71455 type:complete len:82 (-) Transcript_20654:155-400(-)